MMGKRVQLETPSRLHFGLLGWGPELRRQYGGVGLMIRSPDIAVSAETAARWQFEGVLAERVAQIAAMIEARLLATGIRARPCRISVVRAPLEHVGLGVGTQLSLAVGRAILEAAGDFDVDAERLARLTGRGLRSGIGLHGFLHGGLIVDGGRKGETDVPPLLVRMPFPDDWSVLLVQPEGLRGLHGRDESRAFASLPATAERVTDRMCRIVLTYLLPAVVEHDLASFGSALGDLQALVGSLFAPAQGGAYSAAQADSMALELRRMDFVGIGQSSWGPSLYAFTDLPRPDLTAQAGRLRARPAFADASLVVTAANNEGMSIHVEGQAEGTED
jgi:beta-RFAP synthase